MKLKFLLFSLCMLCVGIIALKMDVSAMGSDVICKEYITGEELQELQDYMVSNTVNGMRAAYAINWTVPANTRYKTGSFSMSANKAISINLRLSASAQVGIIGFNGEKQSVTNTIVNRSFYTGATQTYCVFVQNNSSSSITASGTYQY